jgi:hypothetical protein
MNTKRRFVLSKDHQIIDTLNATRPPLYLPEDAPDDEKYLRERVFIGRLPALVNKLIFRSDPDRSDCWSREFVSKEAYEIFHALIPVIRASHLNALDPGISTQHERSDELSRLKQCAIPFTSLSLFADDVELLLRDLYGVGDIEALERVRSAVLQVVFALTKHVRRDLWQEHEDAIDFDFYRCPLCSDVKREIEAQANLMARVLEINANPTAFGEYTVASAKHFSERWDCSGLLRLLGRSSQGAEDHRSPF